MISTRILSCCILLTVATLSAASSCPGAESRASDPLATSTLSATKAPAKKTPTNQTISNKTASKKSESKKADGKKFQLRYKFKPGELIRTKVVHQAAVRTTIEGNSQTAETVSVSVKSWKVTEVNKDGHITFVHSVEYVDMKNDVTGRDTLRFDSRSGGEPPSEFKGVAKRVGIPLTKVVINNMGKILDREDIAPGSPPPSQITMPLPEEPIAVGHVWTFPYDITVKLQKGTAKTVKARERFELTEVDDGIAKISMATQILSPINSPEVKSQLVQRESEGTVRFDIAAGRVVAQQIELDRRVVGYPNEKSSMHYRTRFRESLLKPDRTAAKPKKSS